MLLNSSHDSPGKSRAMNDINGPRLKQFQRLVQEREEEKLFTRHSAEHNEWKESSISFQDVFVCIKFLLSFCMLLLSKKSERESRFLDQWHLWVEKSHPKNIRGWKKSARSWITTQQSSFYFWNFSCSHSVEKKKKHLQNPGNSLWNILLNRWCLFTVINANLKFVIISIYIFLLTKPPLIQSEEKKVFYAAKITRNVSKTQLEFQWKDNNMKMKRRKICENSSSLLTFSFSQPKKKFIYIRQISRSLPRIFFFLLFFFTCNK